MSFLKRRKRQLTRRPEVTKMKEQKLSFLNSKKFLTLLGFLGLYLISTGTSWLVFSSLATEPNLPAKSLSELESERSRIAQLPKTEECPLNGGMFTKVEREIWEERAPMAVVIENHLDSRPQSGLSRADVVYEVVAEGGITRFLALFYCGTAKEDVTVAPIRSARIYLIDWAAEYGEFPLFVHFGGANNICGNCPGGVKPRGTVAKEVMALEKLINMGWRHAKGNALDGGANVSYPAIKRDQYRLGETPAAWEHSAVGSTDLLFELGIERGFNGKNSNGEAWYKDFIGWKFEDDKPSSSPEAANISFEFWSNKPDYDVEWKYDQATNRYLRFNTGKAHTDWEFDKPQLFAKNVVIMFLDERGPVDKELHMFYETIGKGKAMFFKNGQVVEGTWEKASQPSRTRFYDKEGREFSFVRGNIWIEAVPEGNEVEYN